MSEKSNHDKIILVISGDADLRAEIINSSPPKGYRIVSADSAENAIAIVKQETMAIVFLDCDIIQKQEMDLVSFIKTGSPQIEIIILATIGQIDAATAALKNGASFYLIKPIAAGDIAIVLTKLSLRVNRGLEQEALEQQALADLMAGNPVMEKALRLAIKIAPTSSSVLIAGESGTGKEFFARIIHRLSKRLDGAFIAINCGGVPDTLFESEFFGYKKGAFTGAERDKPGLVEAAHLGTLFLDEVGELSPAAQVKLLRFLQEKSFRRIGETILRSVNTRVIAASNKDLAQLVQKGAFREDLYFRLNVFSLFLPPLRQRKETIPNLIRLFVHRNNTALDKHVNKISKSAEMLLAAYDYPGNIRELENIIEHAVVLADGEEITDKDLPEIVRINRRLLVSTVPATAALPGAPPADAALATAPPQESITLADLERDHIRAALDKYKDNYTIISRTLGISRSTLWRKMKEYGLKRTK
ncbi:MAG: sigma-54 dependent transcriptional regulator [Chitinivibrionales bacterium]|nr:sigma-54 dependent transcriptional regulator [Chitinivibrionales bacterium]